MNGFFAWFTSLLAIVIPGFGAEPASSFSGYVEAKYVYVAPTTAGVIETLPIKEGQQVKKGDLLFTLQATQQQALVAAAEAQVAAARATWQNTLTGGRAEELAASQAAVNKAQADLKLAQSNLDRSQKLFASNTITEAQLDQNRASVQSAQAALNQATAQLAVTSLPAREEERKAAKADLDAAEANAAKAQADLADRSVAAPIDARIERTYYDRGEMAPAGTPVLSLLPANALKVEFYVGERDRTRLTLGETVAVGCDGCAPGLTADVSYLASDPQYTSPIIYSREERGQLVFLAEATLDDPGPLLPGQPVTVSLGK
ncbi:MAG: HlyD family efflux transporter periplasmic adaptor subunit [Devosia sp.]|nr:HlyD family efflux transporter periplasmic adaptor subunit [Devosia sp.]